MAARSFFADHIDFTWLLSKIGNPHPIWRVVTTTATRKGDGDMFLTQATLGKVLAPMALVGAVAAAPLPHDDIATPAALNGPIVPEAALQFTEIDVDRLMGAPVFDAANDQVGFIAELMVDGHGRITGAVITLDHVLFLLDHDIALNMNAMTVHDTVTGFAVQTDQRHAALTDIPEFNG
jgi:hypothetical protein